MAAPFRDRRDAGRRLAAALAHLQASQPLVLALPRGGVPVAYEIASALGAELDLVMVRKLGAPDNEEFALGAVVDGADPQLVWDERAASQAGAGSDYFGEEVRRQLAEIERRRGIYLADTAPIPVAGRTVIVVDDGIATGSTMRAALLGLRKADPARIVLAVPVAPPAAIDALHNLCDEVVCLSQPIWFSAVGAHYEVFDQTGDAEVIELLQRARTAHSITAGG